MNVRLYPVALDEHTRAIFLEVPTRHVVLLQGYFDLYEGLGTVRTIQDERSTVCIITTVSMLSKCQEVLAALADSIPWRAVSDPTEEEQGKAHGYFTKGSQGD